MSSLGGIKFDLSRHPLVTIRLGSAYTNAEWNQMLVEVIELLERGPFGVIVDLRGVPMPNAVQRRSFIAMYESHDRLTRAHFLALGAVGDSVIVQRVITVLNWVRPAPHPVKVFSTLDAAEAWVLAQLPESVRQRMPSGKPRSKA